MNLNRNISALNKTTTKNFIFFQKTNNNFFIFIRKEEKLIFKVSLYSFVGKQEQEDMVSIRNFWYSFTKFIHIKLKRLNIFTYNVVRTISWYYRIYLFLTKGKFLQNVQNFYVIQNFVHNGCKLKKKRRRKRKKLRKKFKSSRFK